MFFSGPRDRLRASEAENLLLEQANAVLTSDLDETDVIGLYAGLRPLVDTEVLQAFSHFSYHHSDGFAMVTECP